jgi:hypothetical protein
MMPDGVDVELQRNASLRGAIGSVRRPDGTLISVALLDSDWHDAHQEGLMVLHRSPCLPPTWPSWKPVVSHQTQMWRRTGRATTGSTVPISGRPLRSCPAEIAERANARPDHRVSAIDPDPLPNEINGSARLAATRQRCSRRPERSKVSGRTMAALSGEISMLRVAVADRLWHRPSTRRSDGDRDVRHDPRLERDSDAG